ncbi:MAG: hypothetical protein QXE77_02480 [Desulfurococcaceae archaeon]
MSRTVVDPENMPVERAILSLRDLREAWRREWKRRGTFAEPLIVITGVHEIQQGFCTEGRV